MTTQYAGHVCCVPFQKTSLCENSQNPVSYFLSVRVVFVPPRCVSPRLASLRPTFWPASVPLLSPSSLSWLKQERLGPGQHNLITIIGRVPVLLPSLDCTRPLFTSLMNIPPLTNGRFSLFQFPFLPCQIPPLLTNSGPLMSLSYPAGGKYYCSSNTVLINPCATPSNLFLFNFYWEKCLKIDVLRQYLDIKHFNDL